MSKSCSDQSSAWTVDKLAADRPLSPSATYNISSPCLAASPSGPEMHSRQLAVINTPH